MPRIAHKHVLLGLALLPLALWSALSLPGIAADAENFWQWRNALVVLSGILALWWASAGIVLAGRPAWLERRFGGLDQLYRLHKHIGIGAGILVLGHWLAEWLPKNLAKAGLLARPARPPGPRPPKDVWVDLAKDVGEWAGYILMALVVIALLRRIPYRYFRWLHKAFGLVFLAGAFHGMILLPASFWQQPLGWLTAAIAAAGALPALASLAGRIGRKREYAGRIEALRPHADDILEVVCRPTAGWPGHRAGQFLFVDFGDPGEGAHPFTIASAWDAGEGTLSIAIKGLGDYTRTLPHRLRVGQAVKLQGPYGGFTFAAGHAAETASRQIWIAGGIGITPFLARLRELAADRADHDGIGDRGDATDFFYCTRQAPPPERADELAALCAAAGVRLYWRATDDQGPLDAEDVKAKLAPGTSVWFCGPAAWGSALGAFLHQNGLPERAFHREAFEFR